MRIQPTRIIAAYLVLLLSGSVTIFLPKPYDINSPASASQAQSAPSAETAERHGVSDRTMG